MPTYYDRVKDTSTTTGTGNVTLSGTAPTGYQTFANRYAVGVPLTYAIVDNTSGLWETGEGYLSAATTLVRESVADGSSGLATLVNFSAGTKDVFVTPVAHFFMDVNSGAILAKINGLAMP
jgi:hypothetical protein